MRVLLIKTSSMGDIIHTFPALTDATRAIPDIRFDWVVEEPFVSIPAWHQAVVKVIPVALRRWRKGIFSKETRADLKHLRETLHGEQYDIILDAQGLMKSAFLTFFAKGKRVGLDFNSARESLASLCYQKKCRVNFYQHAIVRMRLLFSLALDYRYADSHVQFGLNNSGLSQLDGISSDPYLVFLHGTTWETKQWPELYWVQLANFAKQSGFKIKISGGNAAEVERATRIAAACDNIDLLPYLSIAEMGSLLSKASGVVAVDTGFGHLAAALNIPTLSLYGPTNAEYTGALGEQSQHAIANFACAPCLQRKCTYKKPSAVFPACFSTLTPENVWRQLQSQLSSRT